MWFHERLLCLDSFQLHMCGSNMEVIYDKKIPKRLLPVEYLPDDYTGPNNGTIKELIGEK